MAQAPALLPGYQYRVKANGGDLAGEIITILDNITFPDDDPRRRKVTVDHDGETVYMLPRVIEDLPIAAKVEATVVPFVPPTPVQAAVTSAFSVPVMASTHNEAPVSSIGALTPITHPMDPRLDYLRPKRHKIIRKYKTRVMENGMTDIEYFLKYTDDAWREENDGRPMNVMLRGDTQSGKTFLVEALAVYWADKMGYDKPMPIFTLSGSSGVTDYDLFGQTTNYTDPLTGVSTLIWLSGVVDLAARVGGILYLDEANFMGERVTSSLHSLLDHRHSFVNRNKPVWKDGQFMPETVEADFDLWIIATINEGYRGTGNFNEAFAGRFEDTLWGYHDEVERKLIPSPTLRLFVEALRTARQAKALQTPIGTAHMERFQKGIQTFGLDMAFESFLGKFSVSERSKVREIFVSRSFQKNMRDELATAAANAAADAANAVTV